VRGGTPILTWSRKFPSGKSSGEERSYEMVEIASKPARFLSVIKC